MPSGVDEEELGVEIGVGRVDGEPEGEVGVAGELGGFGEGRGVEDEAVAVEVSAGLRLVVVQNPCRQ